MALFMHHGVHGYMCRTLHFPLLNFLRLLSALQTVEVPLKSSTSLRHICHSSQFCGINKILESTLCSIIQILKLNFFQKNFTDICQFKIHKPIKKLTSLVFVMIISVEDIGLYILWNYFSCIFPLIFSYHSCLFFFFFLLSVQMSAFLLT